MNLVIFEDADAKGFYPLAVSHPVFDLFYGCSSVTDRLKYYFKQDSVILSCREHLTAVTRDRYNCRVNDFSDINDDCLLVNAALIPEADILSRLASAKKNTAFFCKHSFIGARLASEIIKTTSIEGIIENSSLLPANVEKKEIGASLFKRLWDIVDQNGRMIESDIELIDKIKAWGRSPSALKFSDNIYIHPSVQVPAGAFFDSSHGSIVIDEKAVIEPRSLIQGPAYVGKSSVVMAGIIREGCSLGPVCKVGGELEESIIQGYSNKCHEGFIGHAYIGEWVNLGALTTNSDLKNNYSPVAVSVDSESISTGLAKVGCFIGDHTKTGIGTLLNTGIVIGFCNNLYGGSLFIDKEIGHFKWGTPGELVDYKIDKAIDVARQVMSRRGREFSRSMRELFEWIKDL